MDNDIFIHIYSKYYKNMLMYAYSLCRNWSVAEELVQNTFLKAFLVPDIENYNIKCWMIKVMRNEYIDMVRKNRRIVYMEDKELSSKDDILSNIVIKDRFKYVSDEIRRLPYKYRKVMEMSVYMNMTDSKIASLMGTTEENIRQIRFRARKKLKERLKDV